MEHCSTYAIIHRYNMIVCYKLYSDILCCIITQLWGYMEREIVEINKYYDCITFGKQNITAFGHTQTNIGPESVANFPQMLAELSSQLTFQLIQLLDTQPK